MRLRLFEKPRNGLPIRCWVTWKYQASLAVLVGVTAKVQSRQCDSPGAYPRILRSLVTPVDALSSVVARLAGNRVYWDVLAEKPIGMDEKEAAQPETAVQGTKLCFIACYSFRYIAALQVALLISALCSTASSANCCFAAANRSIVAPRCQAA